MISSTPPSFPSSPGVLCNENLGRNRHAKVQAPRRPSHSLRLRATSPWEHAVISRLGRNITHRHHPPLSVRALPPRAIICPALPSLPPPRFPFVCALRCTSYQRTSAAAASAAVATTLDPDLDRRLERFQEDARVLVEAAKQNHHRTGSRHHLFMP